MSNVTEQQSIYHKNISSSKFNQVSLFCHQRRLKTHKCCLQNAHILKKKNMSLTYRPCLVVSTFRRFQEDGKPF